MNNKFSQTRRRLDVIEINNYNSFMSKSSDYQSLWKKIKPALDSIDALHQVMSINHSSDQDKDRITSLYIHFSRGVMLSMLRKYKIEIDVFREALEYFFEQFFLSKKDLNKKKCIQKKWPQEWPKRWQT